MRVRHYSPEEAHYSGTDDCGRVVGQLLPWDYFRVPVIRQVPRRLDEHGQSPI
jgi:hypothetical protein